MRQVGHRSMPAITLDASAAKLAEGARFNEEMQKLPTGGRAFMPRGVYRYRSHEEADAHWRECIARGMAEIALERSADA